jgi:hypothetical protein
MKPKAIGGINDDDTKSLLEVAMWATKTDAGDRNEIALFDREMVTWNRLHAGFDMCNGHCLCLFRPMLVLFRRVVKPKPPISWSSITP